MSGFWEGLYVNRALWSIITSTLVAQALKIFTGVLKDKKFNFYWVMGTGGMPLAHSAAVISLVICVAKEAGTASALFAMSILFALINMFDAQTWRRSIGFQAKALNKMMADLQEGKKIEEARLRELVGHTPIEVLIGAIVGAAVTLIFYR